RLLPTHLPTLALGDHGPRGDGGLAALGGAEGRDADEPVAAALALEIAVGVLAGDLDGGGLDARLLAREEIHYLRLEARAFRPSQIHAGQHLGPVLGLRAPRPGMDGKDGVLLVLRSGEHDLDGEGLEVFLEG